MERSYGKPLSGRNYLRERLSHVGVLPCVFRASEALFRTGWFVESLATQTGALSVIRTAGNPLRSRPSLRLAVRLGLVPLPGAYFGFLGGATITYLVLVEVVKR